MKVEIILSISKPSKKEELQEQEDLKQLLEKIKKYGMFDDKGEWIQDES